MSTPTKVKKLTVVQCMCFLSHYYCTLAFINVYIIYLPFFSVSLIFLFYSSISLITPSHIIHHEVAALYKTPWNHIKEGVHPAIAERAMMHFDNGLQLQRAPRSWINKKYTVDQLMEQWKEPEVVVVNYNDVIVRGK